VRATLRTYAGLVVGFAIPAVLLIVLASDTIVRIVFERGAFSQSDTHLVGRIQAFAALQIPFALVGMIAVRLLNASRANRTLMWLSVGNFLTNIVFNYIFMRVWGVAGIALSTSVVRAIAACIALYCVMHRINRLEARAT